MATLKLRHLLLYFVCFVLLYLSDIPGGALLSIAAWLQMCILIWKFSYTAKTQLKIFLYFLTLIPLYLMLGSSSAFAQIYIKENSILYFLLAFVLSYVLSVLTTLFSVMSFKYSSSATSVGEVYKQTLNNIKKDRKQLFVLSIFLLLFALLPIPIKHDYKISLGLILIHLYLNQNLVRSLARA